MGHEVRREFRKPKCLKFYELSHTFVVAILHTHEAKNSRRVVSNPNLIIIDVDEGYL